MKYQGNFRQRLIVCVLLLCSIAIIANASNHSKIEQRAFNSMVLINTNNGIGNGFYVASNLIVTGAHLVENLQHIRIKGYKEQKKIGFIKIVEPISDDFLAVLQVNTQGWVPPFVDSETIFLNPEVYVASGASMSQKPLVELKRVRPSKPGDYCQVKIKLPLMVRNDGGPVLNVSGEVVGVYFGGLALERNLEYKFSFVVPINAIRHLIPNGKNFLPSVPITTNYCKKALRNILKENAASRKIVWLEKGNIDRYLCIPGDSPNNLAQQVFKNGIPWQKIQKIRRVFQAIF